MADLKMPEINYVIVAGNLTKDPIFRETTNKTPVVNFSLASNRRFKRQLEPVAGGCLLRRNCRLE